MYVYILIYFELSMSVSDINPGIRRCLRKASYSARSCGSAGVQSKGFRRFFRLSHSVARLRIMI